MPQHNRPREPLPPSRIERNVDSIVRGLVATCVGLVAFDVVFHFVGHKHVHFDLEAVPGFYAVVGFVSYVGLVMTAKQLRKVVMRPNDYYGEAPTDRDGAHLSTPEGPEAPREEEE